MESFIREYRPEDHDALVLCLSALKHIEYALDPLERLRTTHEFDAHSYTDYILQAVERCNGKMVIAVTDDAIVGCAAGCVPFEEGSTELSPTGRITELFVDTTERSKGIGRMLVDAMETYLVSQGCDSVRLEVFSGNDAHNFYRKLGYTDRCVDMMKLLTKK